MSKTKKLLNTSNSSNTSNTSNSTEIQHIKIHKLISKRGYTSLRKAEELIKKGEVKVNGEIAHIGQLVPFSANITINGEEVLDEVIKDRTYIINKPRGVECTRESFKNFRKTIYSLLPKDSRLKTVGRLDASTTGLLLLTTHGKLLNSIIHPSSNISKFYIVGLQVKLNSSKMDVLLKRGVTIKYTISKAISITSIKPPLSVPATNLQLKKLYWYEVEVQEGKKHIIKELFKAVGCRVEILHRSRIGHLHLKKLSLKEGQYVEIGTKSKLIEIMNQIGLSKSEIEENILSYEF